MRVGSAVTLLIFLFVSAGIGLAQETTGTVQGRVVDQQGLGVPGAAVTITGPRGVKTTTTGVDGYFSVPFLTPGAYTVRVELGGFKAFEQKDITISLGQTIAVPVKLEVGGTSETVNVTAQNPIVEAQSTTVGAVIADELLQNVPVGRRLSDALYLAPGVSSSSTAGHMNPSMAGGSGS